MLEYKINPIIMICCDLLYVQAEVMVSCYKYWEQTPYVDCKSVQVHAPLIVISYLTVFLLTLYDISRNAVIIIYIYILIYFNRKYIICIIYVKVVMSLPLVQILRTLIFIIYSCMNLRKNIVVL